MSKYLIWWWNYTFNIDTLVEVIIFKTLGTADGISIIICERNEIGYFNNTGNILFVDINMTTL